MNDDLIVQLKEFVDKLEKKKDKNRAGMGIGALGSGEFLFPLQHRWLISGEHLPNEFNNAVSIKHSRDGNTLVLSGYEIINTTTGKNPVLEWAEAMMEEKYPDETLTLVNLDGLGNMLETIKFSELKMLSREYNYDYASSEVVIQKMTISFGKSERVNNVKNS